MAVVKRTLGFKKRKVVRKVNKRGKGVKVKLKVKGSAKGVADAVRNLAGSLGDGGKSAGQTSGL